MVSLLCTQESKSFGVILDCHRFLDTVLHHFDCSHSTAPCRLAAPNNHAWYVMDSTEMADGTQFAVEELVCLLLFHERSVCEGSDRICGSDKAHKQNVS